MIYAVATTVACTLLLAGAASNTETAEIRALRVVVPPTLDGRLDDEAWLRAPALTELLLTEPADGSTPSNRTSVRIVADERALYVGVDARGITSTHLGRRDAELRGSDWFHIVIDSYHEHTMAFEFAVNPSGVRRDQIVTMPGESDDSWDPVWEVRTSRDTAGWTAELRIPLASLRYRTDGGQAVWGIHVVRVDAAAGERSEFPHTGREQRGGIAAYAHLTGLGQLPSQSLAEVTPHLVARVEQGDATATGKYGFSAGLDITRSIGKFATAGITLNPDFGQVEADPAVVNLSDFELEFQERRQFFVADAELLRFAPSVNANPLFYSRRIGAPPSGRVDSDGLVEYPSETGILAAGRVVARFGAVTAALLHAITAREEATLTNTSGLISTRTIGVPANYVASRVQSTWGAGRNTVGIMATGFARPHHEIVDNYQRSRAASIGADFRSDIANRVWSLSGYAAASIVEGSRASIALTQRSSARYYQRPDATHLEFRDGAISMSGVSAGFRLAREAGRHWLGSLSATAVTPGFEVNDVGFQRRADLVSGTVNIGYRSQRQNKLVREIDYAFVATGSSNTAGEFLGAQLEIEGSFEFANRWQTQLEFGFEGAGHDDRLTRGGPMVRRFNAFTAEYELSTDARRRLSVSFEAQGSVGEVRRRGNLWASTTYRAMPNLSLSITPELNVATNHAQYVRSVPDQYAPAHGHRYVFMQADEESFSVGARIDFILTPALTVQAYARPFAASVDFLRPSELHLDGRDRLRQYGSTDGVVTVNHRLYHVDPDGSGPASSFVFDDPTFSTTSLNSNVTARWEWRAGSTLYLAWQSSAEREMRSASGVSSALFRLATLAPRNVLMLKLSHQLGSQRL